MPTDDTSGRDTRRLIDCGLLLLIAAATVASFADIEPLRVAFVLTATCLVPGGAILARLGVAGATDMATTASLTIGLSLAVDTAASLALVWSGWWHPELVAAVIGAGSICLLLDDLRRMSSARAVEVGL